MRHTSRLRRICRIGLIIVGLAAPTYAATNIFNVINSGFSSYQINGANNPDLALVRGFTYQFQVSAPFHPFYIKSVQTNGTNNAFSAGVTGNGATASTITFTVPTNAPALLFYNCSVHLAMTGRLNIEDPPVVRVTSVTTGTNLVLTSTGTGSLNLHMDSSTSLMAGVWSPMSILINSYLAGTNTTTLAVPADSARFFRVHQALP